MKPELSPDELNYLLRLSREDLKQKEGSARSEYSFKILLKFRKDLIHKLERMAH